MRTWRSECSLHPDVPMKTRADLTKRIAKALTRDGLAAARALLATIEDPVEHQLGRATLALLVRDCDEAVEAATHAVTLGGGALAHYQLALAELLAGRHAQAAAAAGAAASLDGAGSVRVELAMILLASSRPVDARVILHGVTSDEPGNVDARLVLAAASSKVGDYDEAIRQYARAYDLDPLDSRPVACAIEMFAELGKWLGAIAALRAVGRTGSETAALFDVVELRLFEALVDPFPGRGTLPEADALVRSSAVAAAARSVRHLLALTATLVDLGRDDEATSSLEQVEPVTDTDRATRAYLRGILAERRGERTAAMDAYRAALAFDRCHAAAAANAVGMLLAEATEPALAHVPALLDEVEPMARGSSPHLLYKEAVYAARLEDLPRARDLLLEILAMPCRDAGIVASARRALEDITDVETRQGM
jgi:tetratricopeptide (TPR) repeat protein